MPRPVKARSRPPLSRLELPVDAAASRHAALLALANDIVQQHGPVTALALAAALAEAVADAADAGPDALLLRELRDGLVELARAAP